MYNDKSHIPIKPEDHSLRWEQIISPNNINDIFSNNGINDYTNSKIITEFYDINIYEKEHSENKCRAKKHRIILTAPFPTHTIKSYGLMVFAKDTKRWAIIQRKHSVELLLIIRGFYRQTFLYFLLSFLQEEEALIIKNCLLGNIGTFINFYLEDLCLDPSGLLYALVRMAESKNYILEIINKLDLSNNQLSWTWPKGRLYSSILNETPFECAKREFSEEVEIDLPPPIYVSETLIYENITTITGRNIGSCYWIYILPNEIPMTLPKSHPEVSNRLWVSTESCYEMIPKNSAYKHLFKEVLNMF